MGSQQTGRNIGMEMRNGAINALVTPKNSSTTKFLQEKGDMTLKTSLPTFLLQNDNSKNTQTALTKPKRPEIAGPSQKSLEQVEEVVVLTNVQTPYQRKGPTKPNSSPNLHKPQAILTPQRNPISLNEGIEAQKPVIQKPTLIKPINFNYGKPFQHHNTSNFENPYINKYREYEYHSQQTQGNNQLTQPIQYASQPNVVMNQQSPLKMQFSLNTPPKVKETLLLCFNDFLLGSYNNSN